MNFQRLSRLLPSLALVGMVVLSGCPGSKPVTVKGKLVLPKEVKLVETDSVSIGFAPESGEGDKAKGYSATLDVKELAFETPDVVPGKYKVTVNVTPYAGMKDSEQRARALEGFNRAYDSQASKLTFEVTADPTQTITVDLTKNAITKN